MEWHQLIVIAIGLLNLVAVPFVKSILARLSTLESDYQNFRLDVAKDYVTKDDMKEHVSTHLVGIEEKISSLESLIKQSLKKS